MNQEHNNQSVYTSSDTYIHIGSDSESQTNVQREPLLREPSTNSQHVHVHVPVNTMPNNANTSSRPHNFLTPPNGARNHAGGRRSLIIRARASNGHLHHNANSDAGWLHATLHHAASYIIEYAPEPFLAVIPRAFELHSAWIGGQTSSAPEVAETAAGPSVTATNAVAESTNHEVNSSIADSEIRTRPATMTRTVNFPHVNHVHSPAFVNELSSGSREGGGSGPSLQTDPGQQSGPSTSGNSNGTAFRLHIRPRNQAEYENENNVTSELVYRFIVQFIRYMPLLGIILIKSVYDHWLGILDIFILQFVVQGTNRTARQQAAKLSQRDMGVLYSDYVMIIIVIICRFSFAHSQPDCLGLLINAADDPTSLGQLLYAVAVNDMILKLITISIKFLIIITAKPSKSERKGRLFALIEAISQLYRSMVPIKSWLLYLVGSYTGLEIVVGMFFFSSLYMGAKVYEFVMRCKFLKSTFCNYFMSEYGRQPTKEELAISGNVCPICHDPYNAPVLLKCKHIFCESCIETWFKREQTCPMCRVKVAEDRKWQNGATSLFFQLC